MSLREIGRLGAGSSVRTSLDAYLDDLDQLLRFVGPPESATTRAYEVTIPAMTAGSQYVLETDLGQLNHTRRVLFGMFSASGTNVAEVEAGTCHTSYSTTFKGLLYPITGQTADQPSVDWNNLVFPGLNQLNSPCIVVAYPDYRESYRLACQGGDSKEKYGSGAGTTLPTAGFSYAGIGAGVLVGWYGTTGVWGLDKKIELQSAFITVTTSTVLSLTFNNQDSTVSSAKNLILGIFD